MTRWKIPVVTLISLMLITCLGLMILRKYKLGHRLTCAVSEGKTQRVIELINKGASVNIPFKHECAGCVGTGWYPIHIATILGNQEMLKILIRNDADVNSKLKIEDGCTPLHLNYNFYRSPRITDKNRQKITRILVENGADPSVEDRYGRTPLYYAMEAGFRKITDLLYDWKIAVSSKDKDGRRLLHVCATHGYEEIASDLITYGADPNIRDNKGRTPLHLASANGHLTIVKLLLESDADFKIVSDASGTPLHCAAGAGNMSILKLLLDNGSDSEIVTPNAGTPFHRALCGRHYHIAEYLIKLGIDPDIEDDLGRNAMDSVIFPCLFADIPSLIETFDFLIALGSDVNHKDLEGRTVLFTALGLHSEPVISKLIDYGAEVNIQDNEGTTPLHLAAVCNHVACGILLSHGADHTIRDHKGQTPYDVWNKCGRHECCVPFPGTQIP